jgi:hypothetical protein
MRLGDAFRSFLLRIGVPLLALSVLALSVEARSELHSTPQHLSKKCDTTTDALDHRTLPAPLAALPASPVLLRPSPGCASAPAPADPLPVRPVKAPLAGLLRAPPPLFL